MARQILTDEHWSKLKCILRAESIYDKPNLHLTVEGMLYRMRTGCRWRDLPDVFGSWTPGIQSTNVFAPGARKASGGESPRR